MKEAIKSNFSKLVFYRFRCLSQLITVLKCKTRVKHWYELTKNKDFSTSLRQTIYFHVNQSKNWILLKPSHRNGCFHSIIPRHRYRLIKTKTELGINFWTLWNALDWQKHFFVVVLVIYCVCNNKRRLSNTKHIRINNNNGLVDSGRALQQQSNIS